MSKLSRNTLGVFFLVLWIAAVIVVVGGQLASHATDIPLPKNVERFVTRLRDSDFEKGRWGIVHVIYDSCSCTNSLLKHFVTRGLWNGGRETILVIGARIPFEKELVDKGFKLDLISRDEFVGQYGIEAAPIMAVLNPAGDLRYLGGYFKTSEAKVALDQEILEEVAAGRTRKPELLYGCAVSARLEKILDPLGIQKLF